MFNHKLGINVSYYENSPYKIINKINFQKHQFINACNLYVNFNKIIL